MLGALAGIALSIIAPGSTARWIALMVAPGAAAYLIAAGVAPRASTMALWSLVLSPLITTLVGLGALAMHLPLRTVMAGLGTISVVVMLVALWRTRARIADPDRRSVLWLGAMVAVVVVLTAFLPMTREWWRIRSDAWFHAAVVAQIGDFGIPPEDPYFAGISLQYMWFYHVLVLSLSRTLEIDPFRVMALINIQAVAGLGVGAWMLAGVFRRTFAHRLSATLMLLFGFNGAFFVFLPVKAIRALTGEVRGWEEIRRTYSLTPFDYDRVCDFMNVYYNQEFFLDKYMVATAFGLALTFLVAGWYATAEYLRTRHISALILLGGVLVGMLGFHSLVGFVMLVAIFGGVCLAWFARDRGAAFPMRHVLILLGVSLAAFLSTTPYLHEVMHLKEKEQVFPLSLSFHKTVGILISCALALTLWLIRRPLLRDTSLHARAFLFGVLSVAAFCLVIRLPCPNTYDKLGYLIFMPLSILGGIALAELWLERPRARRALAIAMIVCMLPGILLGFAGAFATPDREEVTPAEARLSTWLRENTPRDALLIDDGDRVPFLVTVPRRYVFGLWAYAEMWGYPRLEMSRRVHMRRALYAPRELDATALDELGRVDEPLFAIVRPEHRAAGAAVITRPDLFQIVHEDADGYGVVRVDTAACRALAAGRSDHILPEELIRESGL